jgi:protein-S-isoprenylcysteine O-methyltransferase Ste14
MPMSRSRRRLYAARAIALLVFVGLATGTSYWTTENPILEELLFFIGVVLASLGAVGRLWAISYISGNKNRILTTTGPYSLCRNPLYFFSIVLAVGLGFCTETFTFPVILGATLLSPILASIKKEEQKLCELFGEEYESYRASVPCLLPSFRNYSTPETINIRPAPMTVGFLDCCAALTLIGAVEMIEGLHRANVLPSWFTLY